MFNRNNKNESDNMHGHGPIKFMLHMVVCCGLPILIVTTLPFISRFNPAFSGILGYITPFICPIMMGAMILMMFRNKDTGCCKEEKVKYSELPDKEN